ncbi:MAG TPA: glycogen/starch/alpha-glucan phosphorylase [Thermodesulfobacteriota bacterium]|nr:glycogen/starch/alpha-glucan phosphorylase [Thermodesulfobacteriota bacterium]
MEAKIKKPNNKSENVVSALSIVSVLKESIRYHIKYTQGKNWNQISKRDIFHSVVLAVREWMIDGMFKTQERYQERDVKRLYYLSMEYLVGRSLGNNLYNLGIFDLCKEALSDMGVDLEDIIESESDAALGNGGLGRLAACFLDSLATLGMPGYGYGINYEFGLFKQEIDNGYQVEKPDHWLSEGSPWLIERPDDICVVPVYGRIENAKGPNGNDKPVWTDYKVLLGVPHDMPVVGFGGETVNFLRLYSARSSNEFDVQIFNRGDYLKAVELKIVSETVSKVLYPSDSVDNGKELRLVQEYFLVTCALHDIVRRYLKEYNNFDKFPGKVAIQLNDTHPALAIVELMRILIDEHNLAWERAWEITTATFGYTNHTLMPEALEKWSVPLMEHVLPRHLQIIYDINLRFLEQVSSVWPHDIDRMRRMSIIEEGYPKHVRMAYLSIVGSHSVNGVAALHSELIKTSMVPNFYELWPEKFNNKTNGITQRRWLLKANPMLANLITKTVGSGWITNLNELRDIEPYAEDEAFQYDFLNIKRGNKERLAKIIADTTDIIVNPNSLFDIQSKRIHEYKRQLLNVMHIIHQYLSIVEDGKDLPVPKTYIFAGKAAPGYGAAKLVIKLINNVGKIINNDPRVNDRIKVVFIPDYRVSLAEKIIPAADLSEQVSTAGKEASGTGNMKFTLNGALTIGTLDGANIEIMEEVGNDNIFIFGLTAEEIKEMQSLGSYNPWTYYSQSPVIKRVMDSFKSDIFCPGEPGLFRWIYEAILNGGDVYFHLADLEPYIKTHERASTEFRKTTLWAKKAILNVARIGKFSSDRTISEYAREVWHIESVKE